MTAREDAWAMEGTGDFKALRAKFQNDSTFSSTLLQPAKKLPKEIKPRQSTDGGSTSTPKPKPLRRVQIPNPEQKTEPLNCTSQKSEIKQVKPSALPRVKLRALPEVGKNEHRKEKDFPGTLCGGAVEEESQSHRPASCLYTQEATAVTNNFRHTLHIWESVSSQSDQKCSVMPPQCTNRIASLAQSRTVVTEEDKPVENEQAIVPLVPKNPPHLHSEPAPFPTTSPPIPPRRHMSLERIAHDAINATGFSPNAYDLNRPSQTSQFSSEQQHDVEGINFLKTKPLPCIISLGPPPKKPPRPPKVDLSAFQRYPPDAVDDAYMIPENTAAEGQSTYEESTSYLQQPENSTNSYITQQTTYPSKDGKKEEIKNHRPLTAALSSETEDAKKRGLVWNHETSKQHQAKEIVKIGSHGGILAKPKFSGETRSGNNMPEETTAQSLPGTWLGKDGSFSDGYVCLEALKIDEEKAALSSRKVQPVEEVYDDVEGIVSDTFSSFTSDSFSEEMYEDVHNEDYNSVKPDSHKAEKRKKFGNFFKKGKLKMKNAHLKENCNLSSSVPNLDVMAQEGMVYDGIDEDQNDAKEKNEIHKTWKLRFLASKEKDQRRSSDDAEITPSKNFFKTKKYNLEKNIKMTREEKWFREKFMYEMEIKVINTAVAHCSNTLTKKELDLRITAGEQLEVIDITEGNQLICRNSEGKYGYVLIEHLNFRH